MSHRQGLARHTLTSIDIDEQDGSPRSPLADRPHKASQRPQHRSGPSQASSRGKDKAPPLNDRTNLNNRIQELEATVSKHEGAIKEKDEEIQYLKNSKPDPAKSQDALNEESDTSTKRKQKAKAFAFCHWPWITASKTELVITKLPDDYDPHSRYLRRKDKPKPSDTALYQARLYGSIWEAKQYYLDIDTPNEIHFKELLDEMAHLRSYFQNRLRENGSLVFDEFISTVPAGTFDKLNDETKRASNRVHFNRLLDWDPSKPTKWNRYPPVIKSRDDDGDPEKFGQVVFRNDSIVRALVLILFGKSRVGEKGPHPAGSKTNAHKWNVKKVAPGMVALVAVGLCWSISADTEFSERGNKTEIDYVDRFLTYKKFLVDNAEEPDIKELFQYLDAGVFFTKPVAQAPTNEVDQNPGEEDEESEDDADRFESRGRGAPEEDEGGQHEEANEDGSVANEDISQENNDAAAVIDLAPDDEDMPEPDTGSPSPSDLHSVPNSVQQTPERPSLAPITPKSILPLKRATRSTAGKEKEHKYQSDGSSGAGEDGSDSEEDKGKGRGKRRKVVEADDLEADDLEELKKQAKEAEVAAKQLKKRLEMATKGGGNRGKPRAGRGRGK